MKIKSRYLLIFAIFTLFLLTPTNVFASNQSIDINTATLEQLDQLAGIGPKYAQAIIDARPFSSLDDLLKVKGIAEKTLQKIKDQGLACVACPTEGATTTTSAAPSGSPPPIPPTPPISPIPPISSTTPAAYPINIFFSEILPAPEGADAQNEWLELYNANNFSVNLNKWQIKDTSGAVKTYTFNDNEQISANGFLVILRPESKITLQNNGDGLVLLNPTSEIVDRASYETAPSKQSFAKIDNKWQWTTILTPGKANQAPASESPAQISAQNEQATDKAASLQAQVSDFAPKQGKKTFNISRIISFIIGILIALSSAVVVFFLKTR